jgi:hypothetical protein
VAEPTRGQHSTTPRRGYIAAEVVSAAVIVATVAALPWANYRLQGSPAVSLHVGGALAVAIVATAAAGVLVAGLQLRWRDVALAGTQLVVSCAALVLCVVAAAGRISHANSVTDLTPKASVTAFGLGSVLAVLAALVLVSAAVVVLVLDSPKAGDGQIDHPALTGPYAERPAGV